MKLEWLQSFRALVETGAFSAAAKRLHCTQPAVSQQIRALEQHVGRSLFDRRAGAPTPAGSVLYERARHILSEAGSLVRELEDYDESAGRELRIGASDTTALYYLPPYVRQFRRDMPQTRLVVVCRSSAAVEEQVLRGDLDLGIVTLPAGSEGLETVEVFEQRFVLAAPKQRRIGRNGRATLAQLEGEPFVMLESGARTGALLEAHLSAQRFTPNVVLDSGSFEVIKRYVAEGVGLAFLPEAVIDRADPAIQKLDVPGLPVVHIGVVWRRHAYRATAERVFLKLLDAAS